MDSHGKVSIEWIGDLFISSTNGPFNEAGVKDSIVIIKTSILNKNLKSWRRLEIWDEETLTSPEVFPLMKATTQWYKIHGCYASAVVIKNNLQRYMVENLIKSGTPIFTEIDIAIAWLDEQSP